MFLNWFLTLFSFFLFRLRSAVSSILCSYLLHFSAQAQKNKKIHPEKNSLHFGKLNFLTLRFRNFLYFLKRKLFLYFRKWNPALFNSSPKNKKVHREKIPYNSGNGTFRTQKVKKSPLLKCFLHIRH